MFLRKARLSTAAGSLALLVSMPTFAQESPPIRDASETPGVAAAVSCTPSGRKTPAVPVPACVNAQGVATDCAAPGAIRLHPPSGLRPASPIPRERDSTDRVAGKSIPGAASGHELFSSVDVVEAAGARRLYVSYNAGVQVWDVGRDPARPRFLANRDGWSGNFLTFPPVSEVLNFIEDVAAVAADPGFDLVAVAGIHSVGLTLWRYEHSTRRFRQLYQDPTIDARQVRFVEHGGRFLVIVGADNGLAIYDASAAQALASPCLVDDERDCGVFVTFVREGAHRYVDAISTGDTVLISAASGLFSTLSLTSWRRAPAPRGTTRFSGELRNAAGNALFEYGGRTYLGVVEESRGLNRERLRILDVTRCRTASCSLGNGTVQDAAAQVDLSGYATANDFLTVSWLDGRPMLYYGVATGNLAGPQIERLFDLRKLSNGGVLSPVPELGDGGGTYTDPCNGATVGYFAHYYSTNAHGLNNFVPRVGKFSSTGHFYRAAATVLDVHVLVPPPSIPAGQIFADGFESKSADKWSQVRTLLRTLAGVVYDEDDDDDE